MNAAKFWELDVKSPPLMCGKQDGRAVAVIVTVVVDIDVDTDVIVFVARMVGHVEGKELEVTVRMTFEAETVIVEVDVQLDSAFE